MLIVDDSAFMRKVISDILNGDPNIEVMGTARNGEEALKKIEMSIPDVVTMDVEMPVLDGISALREIMQRFPIPVIMLSSLTQEGTTETIKALELGAFDFIRKPSGHISLDIHKVQDEILLKIKLAAANKDKIMPAKNIVQVRTNITNSIDVKTQKTYQKKLTQNTGNDVHTIIAIGTSTGGPRALQRVITKFPHDLPASILVVQHMPPGFTKSLAERLDTLSAIKVVEGSDHMVLENGTAYIAPGGHQMSVVQKGKNQYFIQTDKNAEHVSGHKPSVDNLFNSIAELSIPTKIIVIMTGMGGDGAKGLVSIKKNGMSYAIAEEETTCVVFGMPRVAIETGQVDEIVPVDDITDTIMKYINSL